MIIIVENKKDIKALNEISDAVEYLMTKKEKKDIRLMPIYEATIYNEKKSQRS